MATYELNVKINGVEQSVSTIGALEQAIKATNDELAKTDANTKSYQELQTQAKLLETEMSVLNKDASQFNNSVKILNTTTSTLNNTILETANAATQLNQSASLTNLNSNLQQANTSTQSLRTELRQITQELQQLEPGSARFQQLSVRAGELRDTIGDTNNVVSALAGNATERLGTALNSVVNIGITGLQGVVGSMKLFGVESEQAREVLEKLQGLLFATQAIQGLGALPDSIAAIRAGFSSLTAAREADLVVQEASIAADGAEATTTTINTGAQAANTIGVEAHTGAVVADTLATEGAAVATEGFTAALAANPIGLVVVGLTALIGALLIFSEGEKTAKSNIDETTGAMLDQSNQIKAQEDAFIDLYKTRKELEILQEKDGKKRITLQTSLDEEILGLQEAALEEQVGKQIDANAKLLDEFSKYKAAYIGQRSILVREVSEFDEFGVYIGKSQEFRTETFKIGEGVLQDLKDRLSKEKKEIASDVSSKQLTQEEGRIKEEQATTRFYIDYLTKQKEFLAKSQQADDKAQSENITKLINSFIKVRTALEKALAEQIKLRQEAEKKVIEEQNAAAEEAARKRQAALEKARADYKRAYDDIVKTVKDANKQLNDIETNNFQALEKLRLDQTTTTIDNLEYELKLEEDKVKEVARLAQEQLKASVLFNKKKKQFTTEGAKAEQDINTNLQEALAKLDEFYAEKKRIATEEETKLQQQKADKIKQINEILNTEITFGDQNVADQKFALLGETSLFEQKLRLEQLDADAALNDMNLKNYVKYLQERATAQALVNEQQRLIDIKVAEDDAQKSFNNFADLLQKEGILAKDFSQQELDRIKTLNAELAAEELKAFQNSEGNLKDNLTNEERARAALLQTQVNQQQVLDGKKREIDQKYNNDKSANDKKTEDDILAYKLKKLDEYNQLVNQSLTLVTNLFAAIADAQKAEDEARLQEMAAQTQAEEKLLTERYNAQLTQLKANLDAGVISQEEYNQKTQELDLIRGNAVKKLNDKLNDEQIKAAKTAFEKEKKIKTAQAIIAGLHGAVSAFTGAFTSIPNPIVAAVVGGVFAALVAATTAAQVSAIQKTKFDSTGLSSLQVPDAASAASSASNAVAAPAISSTGGFTTFNDNALTGSSGGGTTTTPIGGGMQKVYVLESDISAVQQRVRVLENNSTFG
jgi:hypothetical protein